MLWEFKTEYRPFGAYIGCKGENPNSLFHALIDESFDLHSTFLAKMSVFQDPSQMTEKPKSTRKYLLDTIIASLSDNVFGF